MHVRSKKTTFGLAILGCISIFVFFLFSNASHTTDLLRQTISTHDILNSATVTFDQSEFADYDFKRETKISLNKDLFIFAQTRLNNDLPDFFYPVASCRIEWRGMIETKKEGQQEAMIALEYDYEGRLIYFEQKNPELRRSHSLKESDALARAKQYLQEQNIDTSEVKLSYKIINKDNRLLQYEFTFTKASPVSSELIESYDINITGANIVLYQASLLFESNEELTSAFYSTSQTISHVSIVAVWCLIGILLLAQFFKKIRHDELEYKRGLRLGALTLVLIWATIALESVANWENLLLRGGFLGIIGCVGFTLVYAVTESFTRDVWPEKMALLDVVWRGFLRVREIGQCVLDALPLAGISLLAFALMFKLVPALGIGHLEFSDDAFQIFHGPNLFFAGALGTLITTFFIGSILFAFWSTYLRARIKNNTGLLLTFAVFINIAVLHLSGIEPTLLSFALVMPLAVLWSHVTFKYDLTTVFLALIILGLGKQLILLPNLDSALLSLPGLTFSGLILVVLISGVFFIFSPHSIADFANYVPAYVSRIAERERFLKELEIARRLQMRFLPQAVPNFPSLDIACICKPAMEVGGDYYDFIQNGNNSLGVIIGDVSGKGVSAAFYMTMAKGIIKTLARATSEPKQILSEMNTIFYENVPKDVFISVIYGEFNLEKNILKFARAGHNPLMVCKSSDKQVQSILPRGLAIGLDHGNIFKSTIEEIEIPFEENDVFVFFTDGISESTNGSGDEFGEVRLQKVIQLHSEKPAEELINSVSAEVDKFSGTTSQHDDLTMVIVKVGNRIR